MSTTAREDELNDDWGVCVCCGDYVPSDRLCEAQICEDCLTITTHADLQTRQSEAMAEKVSAVHMMARRRLKSENATDDRLHLLAGYQGVLSYYADSLASLAFYEDEIDREVARLSYECGVLSGDIRRLIERVVAHQRGR